MLLHQSAFNQIVILVMPQPAGIGMLKKYQQL